MFNFFEKIKTPQEKDDKIEEDENKINNGYENNSQNYQGESLKDKIRKDMLGLKRKI